MDNLVIYHLHTMLSNPTAGTGADSSTSYEAYLDLAERYEMKAIAFSEHGNIFNWLKKKEAIEKRGMKYIHANEVYLTEHNDKEKGLIRDNFHFMLLAKNFDGVKELNKLTSKSFNREDGHFYYNPRITFEELFSTSDNILMTSACLASPFWRYIKKGDKEKIKLFQDFFEKNKHRAFLEIQYHDHPEQIEFNKWLYDFSKESGVPLIAGTDTHALNKEHQEARKILMKAKGASYGDEDLFDLTFKSYEELVDMFKKQAAIPKEAYLEAINNTNILAEKVEEFSLDKSAKYPKLYDNPIEIFKEKIKEGIEKRGINSLPKKEKEKRVQAVKEEFPVYKKLNTIDYMLLQKNIIDWCEENGIYHGYGRGSVNGSYIAYLLGITEMDSVKHKLNFFRFLNPNRVSLADIDIDFPPSRRKEVIDYVANLEGVYFSEIITFNTIALKGAIREVGRALQMPLSEVDEIAKKVDLKGNIDQSVRDKYEELFKYVDLLSGTVVSIGSHPSGFLVSPIELSENIGLCYTKESKYAVSQLNMKELDSLNYVKLDILGLDNIEIINNTCISANIERLTPDNIDEDDMKVWESLRESTLGVFQWESATAKSYIERLFSKDTLKIIKNNDYNISMIDLLSVGNGAIRPSGASYRDDLAKGIFHDNGHEALNRFLSDTLGYLVYQEQIMQWLTEFCGFHPADSDSVRRGLAKKSGTEEFLPNIREGFVRSMKENYDLKNEEAEQILDYFIKVIKNASDYGFSLNHSKPYSYLGYICAYLRHYYPLEFLTEMMNINFDDQEKTSDIIQYAKQRGIALKPIKYGKSKSDYTMNKKENAIYKGIGSIKFLNKVVAEELYDLSKNNYNYFIDLVYDAHNKTSATFKHLKILASLIFFEEFGGNKKLLDLIERYEKKLKNKKLKEETKEKRLLELRDEEIKMDNEKLNIKEQIQAEIEYYGYETTIIDKSPKSVYIVTDINTKYTPVVRLYRLQDGVVLSLKCKKTDMKKNEFGMYSILSLKKISERNKRRKVDGQWTVLDEKEQYLSEWEVLR
ncbi:DNA polymerase III subunit alpha [Halalkalibacter oceani]|uniref:DNA polymerase III subunit alpha n=1 Tax=Halalkalibacter oceani TaxID=1653776 RepID=UPI0033968401